MARVVALLRGINVGGRHKVPMADLRAVVESIGLTEIQTYIQSGNVVATDPQERTTDSLRQLLETAIQDEFGFPVPVVMVSAGRFRDILADCPWPAVEDPRCVHAIFYPAAIPTPMLQQALDLVRSDDTDQVSADHDVVWLHTPAGLSTSRMAERLMRLTLPDGRRGTARNLRSLREITARL
ncbi:DUF1697 domain-containing protein [Kocuria sp. ZOR0020]|uniref:DUF1697 domain-containing protein n=1 Tax=Kocuria sp. ZOR0020 TaxID=1339234 RepID=UPI00064658FB|nr:DUF1697 domain-containing protein [Kocuria sp. ZOR0020]